MRADHIRVYKSVHTWTGILTGMALFIAFYAGALTVFKEPLQRWASPPAAQQALPLSQAHTLITQTLAAHPAARGDFSIHLRDAEHLPGRMTWQLRDGDADDHDEPAVRSFFATLDTSGTTAVHEAHPSPLGELIDTLHRVVGLPVDSDPNRWVMGVVSALYAVALVSGVIVLLPSLVKDFFALRVGRNLKRMWLDAHNVVGIISLPFHIVMALTAVVFAFHDQIYGLQDDLIHGGRWASAFARAAPPRSDLPPRDPATLLPPEQLVARALELSPGFEPSVLQYLGVTTPKAAVRVWGKDAAAVSPRARGGFVALDPYSGRVLSRDFMPGHQDPAGLWISSFFALHMAAFGGALVQWLYFLLGLAGAWLFYSGNLLWIETRRKATPRGGGTAPAQRLDTRLMAAATVGVCLGCVCGISLTIVGGKWLSGRVADLHALHLTLYYGAFFACIGWAFWRGAARASAALLWLAAALTLAIPLTTLLGWSLSALGLPSLDLWAHASAGALGVDATAAIAAAGLAWMARASARRAREGISDSVWSAHGPHEAALRAAFPETEARQSAPHRADTPTI